MKFLATENIRQIKLPELAREAKAGPALVEISEPFDSECSPEIGQAYVGAQWPQLNGSVERKGRTFRHEAGEGVTVEMISMSGVGGPIRIRIMRRHNLYQTRWFGYAMKFADKRHDIGDVLDHVTANDLIEFVIGEGIGKYTEVVNHVRISPRV